MRRRIALLLSIFILFNSLSGLNMDLQANENFNEKYSYKLLTKGLSYSENNGITETQALQDDEGGVSWQFNKNGTYLLSYYVNNLGTTDKVELEFNLDSNGKIQLKASKNNLSTNPEFTVRNFDTANSRWKEDRVSVVPTGADNKGTHTFDSGRLMLGQISESVSFKDQQLSLILEDVTVNILINNQTIKVSTDYLEAGYITEFQLNYTNSAGNSEQGSLAVLKGLSKFESTPIHLYEDESLTDRGIFSSETENIASHPGIKIDMQLPKRVNAANQKFETITSGIAGALEIYDQQETSNGRTLVFDMKGTSVPIRTINSDTPIGKTVVNASNGMISIYLTQSKNYLNAADKDTVIEWGDLKASRLINMNLTMSGSVISDLKLEPNVKPDNQGYTYMEYSVSKMSENTIQIDFKPYQVTGQVVDYAFMRATVPTALKEVGKKSIKDYKESESYIIQNIGEGSYFKIEADLNGKGRNVTSQIFKFDSQNAIVPPSSPVITSVDNIYSVPPERENEQPQAVGFAIEWKANTIDNLEKSKKDILDLLDKGKLYYELTFHTTPKAGRRPEDSKIVQIFEVEKDDADGLKVTTIKGKSDQGYFTSDGTFRVPNVVLKDTVNGWQNIIFEKSDDIRFQSNNYAADVNSADIGNRQYEPKLPGTYYVTLKAILDPNDDSQTLKYRDSSEKSVAIDIVNEIIPVPNDIKAEDQSNVVNGNSDIKYNLKINKVDIESYVKNMLTPVGISTKPNEMDSYKGTYEIFLYQKDDQNDINYTETELNEAMKNARDGGYIKSTNETTTGSSLRLSTTDLSALRSGKLLPIEYTIDPLKGVADDKNYINLSIDNLDANQVYYVVVRVRLDLYKESESVDPRYSQNSNVATFTTTNTPQKPKPEDKVPTTPKNVKVEIDKESSTTSVVTWDKADLSVDENISKIYYEVLRARDDELDENKLFSTIDMSDLMTQNPTLDLVGFSTEGKTIQTKTKDSGWTELTPAQNCDNLDSYTLKDATITSNRIYYYYVRTVCIIDGKVVRSSWIKVTITSEPVEGISNLKVETAKDYSHNTKNEIVVSFDSQVSIEALNRKDYEFEIAVKAEDDEEYSTTKYSASLVTSTAATGTAAGKTHYVYRISGLKTSKRYYIKVRVIDHTQNIGTSEEPPKSLYSPSVSTRTDYDEEDDDKNNKYEEYLKKFDQEVEKIKNKPYWTVESGEQYLYRKDYIVPELNATKEYELQVDDKNSMYYYFPASVFTQASENNVILKVTGDQFSISVRPNTLLETNPEVEEVLTKIQDGYAEDYYVELQISSKKINTKINNEDPISPEISISMDIAYMKKTDMVLESDILMALDTIITTEKTKFISRLERKVENGTLKDSELTELIDDAISDIQSEHIKKVKRLLENSIKKEISISKPDKALLIVLESEAYAANGYYYGSGNWISIDAYSALNGFAVEAAQFGSYVITGQANLIDTVPSLAPYQTFIAKYNLTDFFTIDSYYIKTAATKEQVYSSVARVLGAPRNTDYITYIKGKDIKGVSSLTIKNSIRQDEAIYIVMQGYEKIHNRPIATIAIKNKQSVKNIGAFQNAYRNYVYAAVELKIINNPDSQVIPSKQISVEEFIAILAKMAS